MHDSIYRLRSSNILTLIVLALVGLGVLAVQSASMGVSGTVGWRWSDLGIKQAVFAVIGLVGYFICGRVDYARLVPTDAMRHTSGDATPDTPSGARAGAAAGRTGTEGARTRAASPAAMRPGAWATLRSPVMLLLLAAVLTCAAVLVPHVGIEKNGARRWLPVGFTQLQPSELAKWAAVIFLAWWLTHRPVAVERFGGFVLTLVPVAVLCLLVVIQDFGTAALIGVVALAMLLAGRVKLWHLLIVIPPALAAAAWFIMHKEYRMRRMMAFTDPFADPQGEGYHMVQSLLSYATGGLGGTGLGAGVQKLGYLPEDTTDFVFSVICEELGLGGAVLVIAMYLGILVIAWRAMASKRDAFGRLLGFGIGAMVTTQATINIAVATVSVPTKGLSLPLISAGGSGLVITCCALGVLASVLRHRRPMEDESTQAARVDARGAEASVPGVPKVKTGPDAGVEVSAVTQDRIDESTWAAWTKPA